MDHTVSIDLIRHGKTPGNLRGSFVGSIDQLLSPEGAEELRGFVRQGRYREVALVVASPMRRCVETACILYPDGAARFADDPGTCTIPDLRERCFGEFEDKTHKEIIAIPGYEGWGLSEQSMQFPGGEALEPFLARIAAAFWQQADRMAVEGVRDMAIVTHGGVIMGILSQFAHPARGYFDWACPNGGGYRLDCDTASRRIAVRCAL